MTGLSTRSPDLAPAADAIAERRYGDAELFVRQHLQANPDDPEGLRLLAQIAASAGHTQDAEQLLRKAIALAPSFVPAYANLTRLLQSLGRAEEAIALLSDIAARQPRNGWALSMQSSLLMAEGKAEEAIRIQEALLEGGHRNPYAWTNYGHQLKAVGRFADAADAYRKALQLDPANGHAWWSLAGLETAAFTPADIELMKAAVGAQPDETREIQLRFALGKALGDAGRFQESFDHYAAGNHIRARWTPPERVSATEAVARAEAMFTAPFLERAQGGCTAADPIFILGMPRSGSTLVEQILASHPRIEGAGELNVLDTVAARVAGADASGWSWLDGIEGLSNHDLAEFGRAYLDATRRSRHTQRPFFTDKMPRNWRYIGLILLILPNARIIDVRRHPMACCFSNFCLFLSKESAFAAGLEALGRHYRDYARMLDHFDRVAPGRIHRVFYENLVEDPERETRAMLGHLGLPFDESCLRFYENDRLVHTPSAEQVRRPAHRSRMQRWRDYEPWLAPLKEALGPLLEAYPGAHSAGAGTA